MADTAKNIYTTLELAGDYYKSATILCSEYQIRDSVSLLPNVIEQYAHAYALALSGKAIKGFSFAAFLKAIKKNDELGEKIKTVNENIEILITDFSVDTEKLSGQQEKQLDQSFNDLEQIEWKLQRFVRKQYPKELPKWLKFILTPCMPIARWFNKQIKALIAKIVAFYKANFPKERLNKIRVVAIVIASVVALWWIGSQTYTWYYSEYRGSSKPGLYGMYYGDMTFSEFLGSRVDTNFDFNSWQNTSIFKGKSDYVSIRWSGFITIPESGEYAFFVNADDTSKMFINDFLVIETKQPTKLGDENSFAVKYFLEKGIWPIKIEYVNAWGGKYFCIKWKKSGDNERSVLGVNLLKTK
jgi:hypothetical protein